MGKAEEKGRAGKSCGGLTTALFSLHRWGSGAWRSWQWWSEAKPGKKGLVRTKCLHFFLFSLSEPGLIGYELLFHQVDQVWFACDSNWWAIFLPFSQPTSFLWPSNSCKLSNCCYGHHHSKNRLHYPITFCHESEVRPEVTSSMQRETFKTRGKLVGAIAHLQCPDFLCVQTEQHPPITHTHWTISGKHGSHLELQTTNLPEKALFSPHKALLRSTTPSSARNRPNFTFVSNAAEGNHLQYVHGFTWFIMKMKQKCL